MRGKYYNSKVKKYGKAIPVTGRPIGLWDAEAPTFSRHSAHRWRWDCQPCAPAALCPQEDSSYSFMLEAWIDPREIVRLHWKNSMSSSWNEPATFRLVALCLNQLRYRVHPVKIDHREIWWDGIGWIDLVYNRDQWQALVNMVMNTRVPYNAGDFLSRQVPAGF
jgi:hypothetical protein